MNVRPHCSTRKICVMNNYHCRNMELILRLQVFLCCSVIFTAGQTLDLDIPEMMADALKPNRDLPPTKPGRYDWEAEGQDELKIALHVQNNLNRNVAKNVILFIGDSMGPSTVTAARFFRTRRDDKSGRMSLAPWDRFPHVGMSITHSFDRMTIDSAASGTAIMCGGKTHSATFGLKHTAKRLDCDLSLTERQTSILDYSLEEGKSVGIVTSARLTHATPGAAYGHTADRSWEYEIPAENKTEGCKDVARQLIEDNPNINVLLGGGRAYFMPDNENDPEYPAETGFRKDGMNLVEMWKQKKMDDLGDDTKFKYVYDKDGFDAVNPDEVDYLLGMFERAHMQYQVDRDETKEPSPTDLVEKAIKILQKNDKGFFLLVEGARIDHAHHDARPYKALDETYYMSKQVEKALEMTDEEDTLIIVTADHSMSFTINGYPSINRDILDTSDFVGSAIWSPLMDDGMPYTIVSYSNGPGYDTRDAPVNGCSKRKDYTNVDTKGENFQTDTPMPTEYATHGGEDVTIFANGPMAHLFHGVHEESYIAHVMRYASCVGPNKDHCKKREEPTCAGNVGKINIIIMLITIILSIV